MITWGELKDMAEKAGVIDTDLVSWKYFEHEIDMGDFIIVRQSRESFRKEELSGCVPLVTDALEDYEYAKDHPEVLVSLSWEL